MNYRKLCFEIVRSQNAKKRRKRRLKMLGAIGWRFDGHPEFVGGRDWGTLETIVVAVWRTVSASCNNMGPTAFGFSCNLDPSDLV